VAIDNIGRDSALKNADRMGLLNINQISLGPFQGIRKPLLYREPAAFVLGLWLMT
jgi:hypothetical protein